MSNCPKCDAKLRLTDWKPNCPSCGVNLMFYGFEERFYRDAKLSELSMAGMRAKMRRFKASFNGSMTAKLRIFTCFLPLVSLLIPWGSMVARLPFGEQTWQAGALGIVDLAMGNYQDFIAYLLSMAQSPAWGSLFIYGIGLIALTVAAVLFSVFTLLLSVLSFASLKRMSVAAGIMGCFGALAAGGGLAAGILLRASASDALFTCTMGFGAPVTLALFVFVAVLNFTIAKKGVNVEYAEGDFERAQIYKRVKLGELKLDDLPYPVVETEETRKLMETIENETGGVPA